MSSYKHFNSRMLMGGMKNNREKSQLPRTCSVLISTVFGLHWDEPYSRRAEGNLRTILAQRQVKSLFLFTLQIWGGLLFTSKLSSDYPRKDALLSAFAAFYFYILHALILLSPSCFHYTYLGCHIAGITSQVFLQAVASIFPNSCHVHRLLNLIFPASSRQFK